MFVPVQFGQIRFRFGGASVKFKHLPPLALSLAVCAAIAISAPCKAEVKFFDESNSNYAEMNASVEKDFPDYPWQEFEIDLPQSSVNVKKLTLALKRANPIGSEFIYKVSGVLADGTQFSHPLRMQTGGSPYLTIDYIPSGGKSGVVRFFLDIPRNDSCPQYLDLASGKLCDFNDSRYMRSLGFIGVDRRFYKPTRWNKLSGLAIDALHDGRYKEAVKLSKEQLSLARHIGDRQLIARSFYDLGRAQEFGKLASDGEVLKLYQQSLALADKTVKDPPDFTSVDQGAVLLNMYRVHLKQKAYEAAREDLDKILAIAKAEDAPVQFLRSVEYEQLRIALLEGRGDRAQELLDSLLPESDAANVAKRRTWQEQYPYVALLEHDIADHLRSDPANHDIAAGATFVLLPDGKIDFKSAKVEPDRKYPFVSAWALNTALLLGSPERTGAPVGFKKPVKFKLKVKWGRSGNSASLSKPGR